MMSFYASVLAAIVPAYAQTGTQAPAASVADPAQEAAKRAFESLPEADRVAIQDGLIWTGDYKGIADGKCGKGTRDAIAAFAGRDKLPTDGTLDAKGRAALAAAAIKAKDAVRFQVQTDEKTGVRIGLPLKLLTKVKPMATGTRYSAADESFAVETITRPAASGTLQDSFNIAIADRPARKVTYKVSRPDFFVVTGETGTDMFYTRMARGDHAITGFTITFPAAAKARLDPISIAIANSFVPFPDAAATAADPSSSPIAPAARNASAAAHNESGAPRAVLTASGVTIAPGLILTSLPRSCSDPLAGTKKAKITKHSDSDGLTLLTLAETPATSLPLRAGDPEAPAEIVILSFEPHGDTDELTGAAGDFHKVEATGTWRVLAPVQNPAAGAALLDRGGALAGLVLQEAAAGKPVAGVLPEMSRMAAPASKIATFLAEGRPKPAEPAASHTTGEIVALARAAMVPIYCTR